MPIYKVTYTRTIEYEENVEAPNRDEALRLMAEIVADLNGKLVFQSGHVASKLLEENLPVGSVISFRKEDGKTDCREIGKPADEDIVNPGRPSGGPWRFA